MTRYSVCSAVDVRLNRGTHSAFDPITPGGVRNAVGLSKEQAVVEAARRNAVEKEAGNLGVDWFPYEEISMADVIAKIRRQA